MKPPLHIALARSNKQRLESYRADPRLLKEHYGIEQTVLAGGYCYRQILELVQNGADAILEAHEQGTPSTGGNRIHVLLRGEHLYVANTGAPLSEEGLDALLYSHSSSKRGFQIGRFGLGFKSLLRLNGRIDLFTRTSGGICFDPKRCREELERDFSVREAPGLRLAWPLEEIERNADVTLAELEWAETVVRVEVRSADLLQHLREEIRSFPAEFLLFFRVPSSLTLDDGDQTAREIRIERNTDHHVLRDGADVSRWRVASREVRIEDERAHADATHIHARESVPLAWAMPVDGQREEAGRFWAFFPTQTPTYVPGILNAPWKLNSDRNAIIGGEWNATLMKEVADLIAESLPALSTLQDPGRPLEAFPRQMDRRDDDAAPLVEALWKRLETATVIPDATGTLRSAHNLCRHPRDNAELAKRWQEIVSPETGSGYVHSTCLQRQRSSRLKVLAERLAATDDGPTPGMLRQVDDEQWFRDVASKEAPRAFAVLELSEAYKDDCKPGEWNNIRRHLAIVPTQGGEVVTASQALLAPEGTTVPGRAIVAAALYNDERSRRILTEVLEVQSPNDDVWVQVLSEALRFIPSYSNEAAAKGWEDFWWRLRQARATARNQFMQAHRDKIRVRKRDGTWVGAEEVLLPGALVAANDSDNQSLLVDGAFHGGDRDALSALGVVESPEGDFRLSQPQDRGVGEWLEACRSRYKETHDNAASWGYLEPVSLSMPCGFSFLSHLIGKPNARLTTQFLARVASGVFPETIPFGHCTQSKYPRIDVRHPLPWVLVRYGTLEIGSETVRLAAVMARCDQSALARPKAWHDLSPALGRLQGAFPSVEPTEDDIRALWRALIATLATAEAVADDTLTDLWTAAAQDHVVPEHLPSVQGDVALADVYVSSSPDLARRAWRPDRIVVTLDEHAVELWIGKGARDLAEVMAPTIAEQAGPVDFLVAVFPELAEVLRDEARGTARAQPVRDLKLVIVEGAETVPCLMWKDVVLLDVEQLQKLSRADRLRRLIDEISSAGWLDRSPDEAVRRLGDAGVEDRRGHVALGSTLAERLLRAVGTRREPLLDALATLKERDFVRQCTDLQLAELTLAQLGPATLTTLKNALQDEGLNPPARWNTSEARAFVSSIGFPPEFASAPETKREAEEFLSGPIDLPPLHDFQEEVMDGLEILFTSSTKRRRAVVSLPTGGGKTRVMVEAAVRLVLAPSGSGRSVVWVAQSDELCEQAVQAFRQVWVNVGAQRTELRIVRMWGGNPTPTIQASDRPVVVVASIQTLNSRMGTEALTWLSRPGLVVVDECHHAITPSYSNLLRWLDAEAPRAGAEEARDEPPIVGLSATPFRSDDNESQRLARRFDNRWFPSDQEALHSRLRDQGVLARADYEALQSGAGLLDDETNRLSQLAEPWEGIDFENILEAINQRLGGDEKRNDRLVEYLRQRAERSILFFANSVQHADEMSCRLNLAGITAAAVSSSTPTVARRYFLDRFQRGEIRVLCNHSVLSTGFDAPKTDMVLIARQVFSPVRYMQIVGRGLRGEKNGGTERCRIVTVMDNLGRFQDKHPYHYCRMLYGEGA